MNRISSETMFVTAEDEPTSGIIGINIKGQVIIIILLLVNVMESNMEHIPRCLEQAKRNKGERGKREKQKKERC
jgi:hypothetical protein